MQKLRGRETLMAHYKVEVTAIVEADNEEELESFLEEFETDEIIIDAFTIVEQVNPLDFFD